MSALPPKADIADSDCDVRYVPKADILRCGKSVVIRSPGWSAQAEPPAPRFQMPLLFAR